MSAKYGLGWWLSGGREGEERPCLPEEAYIKSGLSGPCLDSWLNPFPVASRHSLFFLSAPTSAYQTSRGEKEGEFSSFYFRFANLIKALRINNINEKRLHPLAHNFEG